MTWLSGTTTWQNLGSDLTKLACGEMADGNAVTVASGDQWIREIVGQDLLRSPASLDVSLGNMSNRAGYFNAMKQKNVTASTTASLQADTAFCRVSNIFTSNPAATLGRWVVAITIDQVNSVSGNYSTARCDWVLHDADTGTLLNSGNNLLFNAAGVATLTNGLQVTVGSPTGFMSIGQVFVRGFTTAYPGGIDWWGPFYPRRSGAHSFSVNPPGTTATDWDVVDLPCAYNLSGVGLALGIPGGIHQGLGIKTNTGLGAGALYTVSWSVAYQKVRMVNSATAGQLNFEHGGGGKVDTVNGSVYRQQAGWLTAGWLRAFTTPGSVTNSSGIQYWMSVKPNKILVVLNGDPAATGKLAFAYMTTMQGAHSYDKFPLVHSYQQTDYPGNSTSATAFLAGAQISLYGQKLRQDGSEGRDWQTGWMRTDFDGLGNGTDSYGEITPARGYSTSSQGITLSPLGFTSNTSSTAYTLVTPNSHKPHPVDGKWWLYGTSWSDNAGNNNSEPMTAVYPRGYTTDIAFIPGIGWASGDVLTDSVSGDDYFLIAPDYDGHGRIRTASTVFAGGSAILME